jgi:DNA-binding transcriptional MerR regulator
LTFQWLEGLPLLDVLIRQEGEAMAHPLTIGQAAKSSGVATKTIRYYEEIGVLPVAGRTSSGYRQYDQSDVERLRFISRARALGLPLQRLRILTTVLNGGSKAAFRPRLLRLVYEQLAAVQRQIGELELLRQQLERVSDRMRRVKRRRRVGACRCLDTDDAPQRGRARISRSCVVK